MALFVTLFKWQWKRWAVSLAETFESHVSASQGWFGAAPSGLTSCRWFTATKL